MKSQTTLVNDRTRFDIDRAPALRQGAAITVLRGICLGVWSFDVAANKLDMEVAVRTRHCPVQTLN